MKRPWYITVFCLAGWLWLFILFPSIFSPETKKIHLLLPSLYGILIAFLFIALVGVWHLKRWGLEMFFILLFLKTYLDNMIAHSLSRGEATINLSIGFILFFTYGLIITILYYSKMQKGL
ncbi:MAG: hypothetical protein D6799_05595 [Bacteroidetes bacterium]|nr:MAG: hypothetical protein D6799_05595 [Bacteroidota bacterium]